MRRRLLSLALTLGLAASLTQLSPNASADEGSLVPADQFTHQGEGALADGQFEVLPLSTRARTVTGGDLLVGIRGLTADHTDLAVTIDDGTTITDVTGAFAPDGDGLWVGLVEGLAVGDNDLTVTATHAGESEPRSATLPVENHPITGPVFSGAHQVPFVCRTQDSGLGPALDADCSIDTTYQWFYLSVDAPDRLPAPEAEWPWKTADWVELDDPYAPYPDDVATVRAQDGALVPAVARVESTTINRGITRVAVLDDPAARGSAEVPWEMTPHWNDKVLYQWGASCGVGRHQGTNSPQEVLTGFLDVGGEALDVGPELFHPPVLDGYLVAHSTLTTLNTHCNQVLSAETMMMVDEHLTETYGRHDFVMGNGASGGAIQQYTTMNGYPGLLDGGLPMVSFPDVVTTAMSPADCRLLKDVFASDPLTWNDAAQAAVTGHPSGQICTDWDDSFADHLVASRGCHGSIERAGHAIYDPIDHPDGIRCTLQDNLADIMGVVESGPDAGKARRPVDNVGVQYGLVALQQGRITPEQFLQLNRDIGGFDLDGNIVDDRMEMASDLAADMYRFGFVGGRGGIDQAPIIDLNPWVDGAPILGFHDQVRSYMQADRIEETFGARETMSIWSGLALTNDAWTTMDTWLSDVAAARATTGFSADWSATVAAARPLQGGDSCALTTLGRSPVPLAVPFVAGSPDAPCEQVFRVGGSPRIAAGGPLAEDVVKCSLKPLDPADYPLTVAQAHLDQLDAIFPTGVCDWTSPGVGEEALDDLDGRSLTWLSWGDGTSGDLDEPFVVDHRVARSS